MLEESRAEQRAEIVGNMAEGEKRKRRYRPAEPAVPKAPTVVAAPDRAPPASPPSDEIARRDREAVMGIWRWGLTRRLS